MLCASRSWPSACCGAPRRLPLRGRRAAHQRPVIHARDIWRLGRSRREGPPLAGREPDPLEGSVTGHGFPHFGARSSRLLPLGAARLLGFLLGLARIFLAASISPVHPWASCHHAPFMLDLVLMITGLPCAFSALFALSLGQSLSFARLALWLSLRFRWDNL